MHCMLGRGGKEVYWNRIVCPQQVKKPILPNNLFSTFIQLISIMKKFESSSRAFLYKIYKPFHTILLL